MIDELTKNFFETFGIKPKKQCYYWDCPYSTGEIAEDTPMNERDCANCTNPDKEVYPQITDRILLELICALNKSRLVPAVNLSNFNYEDLKNTILRKNINILKNEFLNNEIRNNFKRQVQALFKEDD